MTDDERQEFIRQKRAFYGMRFLNGDSVGDVVADKEKHFQKD